MKPKKSYVQCLVTERQGKRDAVKAQSNEEKKKKRSVASPKFEDEKKVKLVKTTKQAKTETKPALKEEKVTEQDIDTEKQEMMTSKEELKQDDPAQEKDQLQLNQLMSHMLEEELQDVMVQIWKTLPDVASSDVERFVTESLRHDASDDIKKVVGLNVTKRLLDVSNPLFVKVQFSGRPESGFLTKFLQTYNITSFKRINQESNKFAAKLTTISDFDKICTTKDLRCGSAKLKVTPLYKFTKCPDKLKTMYANKTLYEFGTDNENADKISIENNLNDKDNSSGNVKNEVNDTKEVTEKTKTEEKAQENPKPVKKEIQTDKSFQNKSKLKEIQYENEIFKEINEMDPEFNEEMNDDEILALISGGVVVDQCSGSDQE